MKEEKANLELKQDIDIELGVELTKLCKYTKSLTGLLKRQNS